MFIRLFVTFKIQNSSFKIRSYNITNIDLQNESKEVIIL